MCLLIKISDCCHPPNQSSYKLKSLQLLNTTNQIAGGKLFESKASQTIYVANKEKLRISTFIFLFQVPLSMYFADKLFSLIWGRRGHKSKEDDICSVK